MQGYRIQLLLFFGILAACSFLFVKGYKSPVKYVEEKKGRAATLVQLDVAAQEQQLLKALPQQVRQRVNQLKSESSGTDKAGSLAQLANLYDSLQAFVLSGSYYQKLADLQPSEANWMRTATEWMEAARSSGDSLVVQAGISHAQQAYQKALDLNAQSLEAKNGLAICLVQTGNVMQAVPMLKGVLEQDSNNVQAIFTLGMLSVQSGQLDKAVDRFEKLIRIEPFHTDNYYYLADVYNRMGRKDEAVQTLQQCKAVTKDAEARRNIDELIKEIIKH